MSEQDVIVIPLQSGSKGNCFYLESAQTKLLIDAGISFRQAWTRLNSHGRDIRDVDALLLTHDHTDHSRYASDYQKMLSVDVYATEKTLASIDKKPRVASIQNATCFAAGQSIVVGDMTVHSIPTPHDAVDGVAFVVECSGKRVGVLTDLGHAFSGLKQVLKSLDAVVIESNYDDDLLESGPYPNFLKRRITGRGGHLSNEEAAQLIAENQSPNLQWICLCHLSGENNCPEIAVQTHQKWLGDGCPIHVAERTKVSDALKVVDSKSATAAVHSPKAAANRWKQTVLFER